MQKYFVFCLFAMIALFGCAKHDPILPGMRIDVFDSGDIDVKNIDVPELSDNEKNIYGDTVCDYRQDSDNTIWFGDKKIFSGFATGSVVKSNQSPVCDKGFIYTGLSTGEVVKVKPSTKQIVWIADVFRASNLTGGASVVDIIAHVGVDDKYVYAGGLGDAFCKLNKNNGDKIWCLNISVPVDFIMVDDFVFVVGTDNNLYAIDVKKGAVYWKTNVKNQIKPVYQNNAITIGKQRINSKDGSLIN